MGAGPVNPETGNQGTPRPLGAVSQPVLCCRGGNEAALAADPVVTHRLQVAQRRQDLLFQAESRLDQGDQAGGRAGVADVGLGAADITGIG